MRVAGSLKMGWVTSSLLISKLNAYSREHNLAQLLQEYGRLIKTIFILGYLQNLPLRRKINAPLNKGELLHSLRTWLWFGGAGQIRRKQEDKQQESVRCLNLLTNIILTWNTVYIQEIIKQRREQGEPVNNEDLAHISPAWFLCFCHAFAHLFILYEFLWIRRYDKSTGVYRPELRWRR